LFVMPLTIGRRVRLGKTALTDGVEDLFELR
jgi:hypothetical protein